MNSRSIGFEYQWSFFIKCSFVSCGNPLYCANTMHMPFTMPPALQLCLRPSQIPNIRFIHTCQTFIVFYSYTTRYFYCMKIATSFNIMGFNFSNKQTFKKPHWDAPTESMVDSSFFWGYLVTQIPGGFLASVFPANRIFGLAITTSAVLNMIIPGAMSLDNVTFLLIIRVIQGLVEVIANIIPFGYIKFLHFSNCFFLFFDPILCRGLTLPSLAMNFHSPFVFSVKYKQGVVYPACHGVWRFWAPPAERSRLATIAFSGSYAGIVIGMPVSGFLAQYLSWQAPFYFYSVLGIFWYAAFLWLVFEKPRVHPTITVDEMKYIEKSLGENTQHSMPTLSTTPFQEIARSKPVHAIVVANFCRSWNFYMLVMYQSKFMEKRFHFKTSEAGIISALPHLIMTTIVPFGGILADHLRKSGTMTTTNVR